MSVDYTLRSELIKAEACFLETVRGGHDPKPYLSGIDSLAERLEAAANAGQLSQETLRLGENLLNNIAFMSEELARTLDDANDIRGQAINSARDLLSASRPSPLRQQSTSTRPGPNGGPDNMGPLREWFLDHLSHPYPDPRARTQLQRFVPTLSAQQIGVWFVNARRRSGWTDLFRQYANSDVATMQSIVVSALNSELSWQLNDDARNAVESVQRYFAKNSPAPNPEWIDELEEEVSQIRAAAQRIPPAYLNDELRANWNASGGGSGLADTEKSSGPKRTNPRSGRK